MKLHVARRKVWVATFISLLMVLTCGLSAAGFWRGAAAADQTVLDRETLLGSAMYENYNYLELPVAQITGKTVSSSQSGYGIDKAFDNNEGTKWEAAWNNPPAVKTITLTLAKEQSITGLYYVSRLDNNFDGAMTTYSCAITDEAGTTVTKEGTVVEELGRFILPFDEAVRAKSIVISTNAAAITELRLTYIPSTAADVEKLQTEIALMRESCTPGMDNGTYDLEFLKTFDESLLTANEMPSDTAEEIAAKAAELFRLAKELKRGKQIFTQDLLIKRNNATTLLNAADVGTQPLQYTQAAVDGFRAVVERATDVTVATVNNRGTVMDATTALDKAVTAFKIAAVTPVTTGSTIAASTSIERLFDNVSAKRLKFNTGVANNFNGTNYLEFDYQRDIGFEAVTLSSWFATAQGIPQVKLMYKNASGAFVPVSGGSFDANGIATVGWKTNQQKPSEEATLTFTPVQTSCLRLYATKKPSDPWGNGIDDLSFGIAVEENAMQIMINNGTEVTLEEKETHQAEATVLPSYATNKNIIWTSSDADVVMVKDGLITALSVREGETSSVATVTATTEYGNKTASIQVTVTPKAVTEDSEEYIALSTRIGIQEKFLAVAKTKPSEYFDGAITTFEEKIADVKTRLEAATSIGILDILTTELAQARETFDMASLGMIAQTRELIDRVAGEGTAAKFDFEVIPADETTGNDVWQLDWNASTSRPVIRGNNAVSLATAFNYYLKYFCYQSVPYTGEFTVKMPSELPIVTEPMNQVFPHKYRHYFNENCEYKYTTVYYGMKEWRQRLDWMALNGFNMFLFDFDTRAVWQYAAEQSYLGTGITEAVMTELRAATTEYTPDFGEYALSQETIDNMITLGNQVLSWGFELGLEPEIRPFYGQVPFMFPNNHDDYYVTNKSNFTIDLPDTIFDGLKIYPAARWMNLPQGVAFSPYDNVQGSTQEDKDKAKAGFKTISDVYYKAFMEMYAFNEYGRVPEYVYKDLVQEQGFIFSGASFPRELLTDLEREFHLVNPDGVWVMTSWRIQQWEMDYFDRSQILVIDLEAEANPRYGSTGQFWGTPWAWSMLHNFGGNTGMSGGLDHIAKAPILAKRDNNFMSGVSITPEGGDTNPVLYELMAEMTWRDKEVDVDQWLLDYAHRRYGEGYAAAKTEIDAVWDSLHNTAYKAFVYQGPFQTIINAYPKIEGAQARFWGTNNMPYDRKDLVSTWQTMVVAAAKMGDKINEEFIYDLVDLTRQVLADFSAPVYNKISSTYQQNKADTLRYTQMMVDIATDLDEILATCSDFTVGKRLEAARARGVTEADKDYFEEIERTYLTYWIPDMPNPNGGLLDYCNRHLSGLMKDYYAMRWQVLHEQIEKGIKADATYAQLKSDYVGGTMQSIIDTKALAWGTAATERHNNTSVVYTQYSSVPVGDAVEVSTRLLEKWLPEMVEIYNISTVVVKDTLQARYDEYKDAAKPARVDATAWEAFQTALTDTLALLESDTATQAAVNAMVKTLDKAYEDMQTKVQSWRIDLQKIYDEVKDIANDEEYTAASYQTFTDARAAAKLLLDDSASTEAAMQAATTALRNAHTGLVVIVVDKTSLTARYNQYKDTAKPELIEEEVWTAFETALANAKTVMDNAEAKQSQVDAALTALNTAYDAVLEASSAWREELQTLYNTAKDVTNEGYTAASWKAFNDARDAAKVLLDSETSTETAMRDAYTALRNAQDGLTVNVVNKNVLQTNYNSYKDATKPARVDETAWTAFQDALKEALAVLNDTAVEQPAIDAMVTTLDSAYNTMLTAKQSWRVDLQQEYDRRKDVVNDDYTITSWGAFTGALTASDTLLKNQEASEDALKTAYDNLRKAFDDLVKNSEVEDIGDKTLLRTLHESCEALVEDEYTKETWSAFKAAYDKATTVLNKDKATTAEVNDAYDELNAAKNALARAEQKKKGCKGALGVAGPAVGLVLIGLAVLVFSIRRSKRNERT